MSAETTTAPNDTATKRVFAVRNIDQTTVYLYGFGVYQGMFARPGSGSLTGVWSDDDYQMAADAVTQVHTSDPAPWYDRQVADAAMTRRQADDDLARVLARAAQRDARPLHDKVVELLARLDLNPRILLDNGSYAWGCQCWWGDEARFETDVRKGRAVVIVSTNDAADNMT